ncbi:GNS1/SUR4 family-domain-containing protein [Xylariaceae sp. FL0804]|nr:GNS1/SUR4 family-domain-containing protein [Xylariaceae sp. FL0804]
MASPMVFTQAPAAELFKFPPHADPQPMPPPPSGDYLFTIPDGLFVSALDPKVPITIAVVYAVTAKALNVYNKSTNKRPWAISKTQAFRAFVVAHNVFLAVYSAWTWFGMLRALQSTIVSPSGPAGWTGTVDSLCKIHGPTGLRNAVTWNQKSESWGSISGVGLSPEGLPSRADAGRLWNQGLAYYGWLFYISKFYEVLDTLIILAKGKYSSTLQTYHHAGAMMAMWAGMRYMSTPIWLFVFFNSFIHSLMYTYFTITAFNIRVPTIIKRTMTSMQISQFIVGASFAMVHSFISYLIPVHTPVDTADAASSAVVAPGADSAKPGYVTKYHKVDCINTTGATFAIWLNVFYLAPLTYLFVSFFIASYLKRSKAATVHAKTGSARRQSNVHLAEKASWDAARGLEREVYGESKESAIVESSDDNGKVRARTNGKTKH